MKKVVKLKSVLFVFLMLFLIISVSNTVMASDTQEDLAETQIRNHIDYINAKDWVNFINTYTNDQHLIWTEFLQDNNNIENHIGILNIKTASVIEIEEINPKNIYSISGLDELYSENDVFSNDIRTFVVGLDCIVYDENEFFSNGLNYFLFVMKQENQKWYVDQMTSIGDPGNYIDLGYLSSANFLEYEGIYESKNQAFSEDQINTQKKQGHLEEYIINGENIFEDEMVGVLRVGMTPGNAPTDDDTLVWREWNGSSYVGNSKSVKFYDYCLVCSVGEARDSRLDGQARQAITIAIRTFVAYRMNNPITPALGIHVNSTSLAFYNPEWTSTDVANNYPSVKSDYDSRKDIWMYNNDDQLFEATQTSGSWTSDTPGAGSGVLAHRGCYYLLENGVVRNLFEVLHFYYTNSNKSSGVLHFYNSNGDFLPYMVDILE